MNKKEKLQICSVVTQAILSDGKITDDESNFMNSLMDKYELTADEKKEVLSRNINEDPAKLVEGITSFDSKNQLIVELVMAVAADNELSKTEHQLLTTVSDAIGVSRKDMEMLVKNALM